jgi:hypothetical protein
MEHLTLKLYPELNLEEEETRQKTKDKRQKKQGDRSEAEIPHQRKRRRFKVLGSTVYGTRNLEPGTRMPITRHLVLIDILLFQHIPYIHQVYFSAYYPQMMYEP